jgi:protocatechuate 4,5-dioxygenase alpha chain
MDFGRHKDRKEGHNLPMKKDYEDIPGTFVFDADRARVGYHLNQFCISLSKAEGRAGFRVDAEGYLDKFPMNKDQRQAVINRDWNGLLELCGNIYYTSKLAAFDGINFQDLAGLMTGMGRDAYRKMMVNGGRSIDGNRYKSEWEDA